MWLKKYCLRPFFFCICIWCQSCKTGTKRGDSAGPRSDLSAFFLGLLPRGELAAWWEHGMLLLKPLYLGVLPRQRRKPRGDISLGSQHGLVSHANEKHAGRACWQRTGVSLASLARPGSPWLTPKWGAAKTARWNQCQSGNGPWQIPSRFHFSDSAKAWFLFYSHMEI